MYQGLPAGIFVILYIGLLLAAAYIDVRTHRIPNRLAYPAIGLAVVFRSLRPGFLSGLVGGVIGALILLIPVLIFGPDRAGIGDVKWGGFIGLVVGFPAILVTLFVAAAGLSVVGLIATALNRYHSQSAMPFAPFLCLGGICGLIWNLV